MRKKIGNYTIVSDENGKPIIEEFFQKPKASQKTVNTNNNVKTNNTINKVANNNLSPLKKVEPTVKTQPTINSDGYTETNKKYGDYKYQDYANKKDYKVYKKDNKSYYYDEAKKQYVDMDEATMTTKEQDKKEYEEAVKNGFKDRKEHINGKQVAPVKIANLVKLDTSNAPLEKKKEQAKKLIEEEKKAGKAIVGKTANKEPTILDRINLYTSGAKSGVASGLTGIAEAPLQETQNALQKGEKIKTNQDMAAQLAKAFGYTISPTATKAIEDIYDMFNPKKEDKKKNLVEKGMDGLNNYIDRTGTTKGLKEALTAYGATNPNLDEKVADIRKAVRKPSAKIEEAIERELSSKNYNDVDKTATDVTRTVGNMAPSIVATLATKDPNLGLATMGASVKGQATTEAENRGKKLEDAIKIGNTKALGEVATEMLTGGLNIFGKGVADDIAEKAINKYIKNNALNFGAKKVVGNAGEIGEELLSDQINNLIDRSTIDPNQKYTLDDAKNTAFQTLLSTLALNGLTGGYSPSAYRQNAAEINNNNSLNSIKKDEIYRKSTVAKQVISEKIQDAVETGDITPEQGIQELNAVDETIKNTINQEELNPINEKQNNINTTNEVQNNDIATQVNNLNLGKYNTVDTKTAVDNYIDNYNKNLNEVKTQEQLQDLNNKVTAMQENNKVDTTNNSIKEPLTTKEYKEYQQLKELDKAGILNNEEEAHLQDLETKYKDVKIKHPELRTDYKFEDIKQEYGKYKNDNSKIDFKAMNEAVDSVPANNQNRRTKEQWLDVAKIIGQKYSGSTDGLRQYAYRTFFELAPNRKESLNRQGKKYVSFGIADWINEVYKGAGVGEIDKTNSIENDNKIEYNKDGIYINDKNEYGSLQDTVKYLQSQNILKNKGIDFVENGNYWYMISSNDFADFKPIMKIKIDGNEQLIDSIKGEYRNGFNKNSETIDSIIKSIQNDRKSNNRDNVSINTGTTTKQNDRLYNSKQEQPINRGNDIGKSRKNNRELNNSSFSNDKNDILYANKEKNNNVLKINDDGTSEFVDGKPKILNKMPEKEKVKFKDKVVNAKNIARRALFDKGQEVYDIAKKTKNKTLYHKYDNIGIAPGEAQSNIGVAQTNLLGKKYNNFTDKNGNKTSMSMEGIWKDANKSGISDKVLSEYLVNQLNLDRLNQGVEQFGELTAYDSQETIEKIEKEYPQIKRVAENVWQYNKNQLQKMVDGGLISQEMADTFTENTPHYIRIQRNTGKNNNSIKIKNGKVEINNQIQKVKGGDLDIMPIKETMAQYTQDVTNSIRKNIFGKELAKTLDIGNKDTNISAVDESFGINPDLLGKDADGNYTFTIFDNGNAVVLPINEGIYEALNTQKSDLEKNIDKLGTPLRKISSMQRTLLTDKNPLFMATNFFKDIGDAPFNSKYGSHKFVVNYIGLFGGRTAGNLARKMNITNSNKVNTSDYVNLYESLGGNQNSYFNQGEFESDKGKIRKGLDYALTPIEKGNEFIESMPRITEFVTTIQENGYTLNSDGELVVKNKKKATKTAEDVLSEAMYNAAEVTTNFKRGGNVSKVANRNGATFFNASMQGISKFVRNFTEVENPKQVCKLLTKAAIFGIGPALLGSAMYDDDDEYKDLPDYIKDEYYLFKDNNGNWEDENGTKWIRIPKGRMMSIFGSAARRTNNLAKGDKDAFKGFLEIASNQIAPNNPFEDNVLSPLVAVKDNKSWSGNDIESDYLQSLPVKERFDARTSEFSKWLGDKLNYSPKKIDYLLDQYTGGIGDVILPALTNYAESDDDSTLGRLVKNPIKNKFTTDSTLNNKTISEYYDMVDELTQKGNSVKATPLDRAKSKYIAKFSEAQSALADLYKEQREIQNDTTMSDNEKYNKNKAKQREIIDTMKDTMKDLKNASYDGDTITIGNKIYSEVEEDGKTKIKSFSLNKVNEARELGVDVGEYAQINSHIQSLKGDKNEYGKTISGSKKRKVFEYIDSLDLTVEQKEAIYRSYYKK